MAYVPNSVANYQAAFCGAMAGFGFGGKMPNDPPSDASKFGDAAKDSGAFAQAVDVVFSTTTSIFIQQLIQSFAMASFATRSPSGKHVPADFQSLATAIEAAFEASLDYVEGTQGIIPTGSQFSIVKQIQTDSAAGFGTITVGDPTKVTNTVNITVQDGNSRLRIIGQLSGVGAVHDGHATLFIKVDGAQVSTSVESWLTTDPDRVIVTMADIDPPGAGAHVVTMNLAIAGAAGTTFSDNGNFDTLSVEEYNNG